MDKKTVYQYDCPLCDGRGKSGRWTGKPCRGCHGSGFTALDTGAVIHVYTEIYKQKQKHWGTPRIYGKREYKLEYGGKFPNMQPVLDLTELWAREQTEADYATVYHLDEFPDLLINDRTEAQRRLGTGGETPNGRLKYNPNARIIETRVQTVDAYTTLPTIAGEYRWHSEQPKQIIKGKVETNFSGWAGIITVQHMRRDADGTLYGLVLRGIARRFKGYRYDEYPKKFQSRAQKIRAFLDNIPNWHANPGGRYVIKSGVADWQVWIVKHDGAGHWEGVRKLPFDIVPDNIKRAVGHDETNRHYIANTAVVDEDNYDFNEIPF